MGLKFFMGQDASAPVLTSDDKEIDLQQVHGGLPWQIPEDHVVEKLLVSKSTLNTFPTKLTHLTELVLFACCYGISKEDFENCDFDYPALRVLNLKGCMLDTLHKSLFKSQSLEKMDLSVNCLTEDLSFDLPHLKKLNCAMNKMRNLPKGLCDSLIKLDFQFNRLEGIELRLSQLQVLNLAGNNLFTISSDCYFPSLREMDVSYNLIYALQDVGKIAPQLQKLNCASNLLFQFPTGLPQTIEHIDASNNKIVEFSEPISHLTSLRFVDLNGNLLTAYPVLPPNMEEFHTHNNCIEKFESLGSSKIKTIDLTNSKLAKIPNPGSARVTSLYMDGNRLTTLADIGRYSHLRNLRISANQLTSLDSKFASLTNLQTLRLCANMVKNLPDCISNMPLTKLFVGNNPIKTLPVLPSTLEVLNCFKCQFEEISPRVFSKCKNLKIVDFSANKFEKLTFIPRAENVCFSMNHITQIPEIDASVKRVDFSHNRLGEFVLMKHFVMVDVSHNHLTSLRFADQASGCPALEELKLSQNNGLEFELNFASFPALLRGDVSGTQVRHAVRIPATVDEFITASLDVMKVKKQNSIKFFSSGVGYSSTIGRKAHMEDSIIIFKNGNEQRWSFYGVLDGHGGKSAAITGSTLLQTIAMRELKEIDDIAQLIKRTEKYMWKNNVGIEDGACLLFAMLRRRELGIANLGDSRALLVKKTGKVRQLTTDHKATDRGEIENAKEMGTFVRNGRLEGQIAATRTIGDRGLRSINRTPDIFKVTLQDDDYRLILACDGLYDVVTNEEVASIAIGEQDAHRAAAILRQMAIAYGSNDNISVIVVDLSV